MSLSVDQLNAKYGYNVGPAVTNPNFQQAAPAPAPKSSFFGGLANSAINLPQQAIGALYHTTVDPFARLIGDATGASKVMGAVKNNDLQHTALTKQFKHDTQAFKAGAMSRGDYAIANKKYQDALSSSSTAMNQTHLRSGGEMLGDSAQVLGTIATLGAGTLAKGAASATLKAGATKIAGSTAGKVAGYAGKAIDGTIGSGETLGKNIITQGASKLVRNAVVTQLVIQAPGQIVGDVKKGDYAGAALNAGMLAAPGVLSVASKGVKALNLGEKAFGKSATLGDAFGHTRVNQWAKTATPAQLATLKNMELFTENQKTSTPGQFLADHLKSINVDPKTATLQQVVDHHNEYLGAVGKLDTIKSTNEQQIADALAHNKSARGEAKAINADAQAKALQQNSAYKPLTFADKQKYEKAFGTPPPEAKVSGPVPTVTANTVKVPTAIPKNAVITADYSMATPAVVAELQKLGENPSLAEKFAAVGRAMDSAGIQNQTVRTKIEAALTQMTSGSEMAANVARITEKTKINHPDLKLPEGFAATGGPKDIAHIPTAEEVKNAGSIVLGKDGNGLIGGVAKGLKKIGLGLESYNPQQIVQAKSKLTNDIKMLGITRADGTVLNGEDAYKSLDTAKDYLHLSDIRHLSKAEIQRTLGDISLSDTKQVKSAIKGMYDGQKWSLRGAAGIATDANLKYNPIAARYGRIQSKLRYDLNPSFRAQQKIEAATLGQVMTGGYAPAGDISKVVGQMRENGIIPKLTKSFDEAIGDIGPGTKVTTNLTASEENSLARVLQASAAKNGTTIKAELENETTRKIMRAIVQNPKEGFHSSNFAKAMNVAVFPLNYNLKVTGMAVKALAGQPKAVQFGVAKSIADFYSWTKTDAGIKWKSDNSELLGVISYFTPINSVTQIMQGLGEKDITKLGLIGGLPFGVITRVLQGQGIVSTGSQYLNPKTGEIIPNQLPTTSKARLQQATSDILNTMFTYPGRSAGLGSKGDLLKNITGGVLVPGKGETTPNTNVKPLTKDQLNTQRVLGTKSQSTTKAAPISLKPGTVTSSAPFKITPIYKAGSAPKAPKAKIYAKRPGQPF